jgi:tetratricopeptide (TPR) repeat protein
MKIIYLSIILVLISFSTWAQSERKSARSGNKNYSAGNFVDAEINYKKALDKNSDLLEAQFNLGDALVKQERYEEALDSFEKVNSASKSNLMKANALHNIGNVLLSQQDLEGAEESYKNSLRLNPKDNETRYNYAYVKNLIQQQEENENNQDKNQKDNQDENKQDKRDEKEEKEQKEENNDESNNSEDRKEGEEDSDDNSQNNNERNEDNKGETDGEKSDNENKEEQIQDPKNKLSQDEAKKILEALNQQENKVQEKLKKHQLKGKKLKIEKDW